MTATLLPGFHHATEALFDVARDEIKAVVAEVLEEEIEFKEDDLIGIVWRIDRIYKMHQAKLILTLPKEDLIVQGLATWVKSFTGYLAHQQDSGGWAHVECMLSNIGCKPDMIGDWTVYELFGNVISSDVWVGWAIDKESDALAPQKSCRRVLVAIWPCAIFELTDESAWNDWNEECMKMIWFNLDTWSEESDGGKKMPLPPAQEDLDHSTEGGVSAFDLPMTAHWTEPSCGIEECPSFNVYCFYDSKTKSNLLPCWTKKESTDLSKSCCVSDICESSLRIW